MKKYLGVTLVVIISILLYFYMNPNPQKVIENHLKNKYKEEFIVEVLGKREKTYEAIIFPKKYVGTPRENDSYYWGKGFAKGRKGGDTYGLVLLNESTNEFFLPKLKELFGENVLLVLDMGPSYVKNNFKEEMEALKKAYKLYPTASFEPISGGIYIFGRVESDEDREWYRKQIYEFVQFMKETGTFEYVAMQIKILDERCLTNYFDRNKKELLEAKQKYTTSKDYLDFRENFFKKSNNEYEQMTQEEKNIKMDSFNKGEFNDYGNNTYFSLYHMGLTSPKFKDSEPRDKSRRKEYNSISDVQLLNSVKIMYGEYYGDIIEK